MKRILLSLVLLFGLCAGFSGTANAACGGGGSQCFVVAAGGNSGTAATWSATSGGATCSGTTCATGPAATDSVCLDNAAGNLTINAALSIAGFDESGTCTGGSGIAYTNVVTHNAFTLTNSGTTHLLVAGKYTAAGATSVTSFTNAGGGTVAVTTAGNSLGNITVNVGTTTSVTLQDALTTITAATITHSQGIFNSNSKAISGPFLVSTSGTRTLTLNGSTWSINTAFANLTPINTASAGLTCNCTTSTFNLTNTSTNAASATGTLLFATTPPWGALTLNASNAGYWIQSTATFNGALTITNATLNTSANLTFASAAITGNPAVRFAGLGAGVMPPAMTLTSAGTVTCSYCVLRAVLTAGGGTFTAKQTIDLGGNSSSWAITAPPIGGVLGG